MESVVADVSAHNFDIEAALAQQLGAENLPFPGNYTNPSQFCTVCPDFMTKI